MTVLDAHGNPRFCGCPDNQINEAQHWPEGRVISFGVLADTMAGKVSLVEQREDLAEALATWQQYAGFQLRSIAAATEPDVDITLAYRMGPHGDGQPFDHKGGVVGHAWFPPDGRIHHDDSEDWTASFRERVTLHEAGHALGIGHSPDLGNVMYPYVTNQATLGPWDRAEIAGRYGPPVERPDRPTDPITPPGTPPEEPPSRVPPMMVGIRREELRLDGAPVDPALMVKIYASDTRTGNDIAESAYFEDGFFVLEIPECPGFALQMRSPVLSTWNGPHNWEAGRLRWMPVSFLTPEPEAPEEPDPWLPWRTAEIRYSAEDAHRGLEIRFLDTRGGS